MRAGVLMVAVSYPLLLKACVISLAVFHLLASNRFAASAFVWFALRYGAQQPPQALRLALLPPNAKHKRQRNAASAKHGVIVRGVVRLM